MFNRIFRLAICSWHDRCGTTAPLFGLLALPLLAISGLAVDYGSVVRIRGELQALADATAIAGARLPATANENRYWAASHMFEASIASTEYSDVQSQITATNSGVRVELSHSYHPVLLSLFGINEWQVDVTSNARSQIENGGVACLLALNPSTDDGLHLQGINKTSSDNCWAWVNSRSPSSINAVGASLGTAQGFCTAGGVSGGEHFAPSPYTDCEPLSDPFAAKFASSYPSSDMCDQTNVSLKSGSFVLEPGVYCGNTVLKPNADVTFLPGSYVFKDGYLEIQGGASATGADVTFFFDGDDTRFIVRGGGDIDLKAPAEGPYAGFVLVDRETSSSYTVRETVIQGGGRVKLEGVLYAPGWRMNISGNGEINEESLYFAMIADHYYMEGNGQLHIHSDHASAGLPGLMPRIKSGPVLTE
jgi:Flp pilus assembly protein TadG